MSDFTRSLLPEPLAAKVARDPGVASVAKVKLLVENGILVFGLDQSEFAYRRFVIVAGARGPVLAGDHSGKRPGQAPALDGRTFASEAATTFAWGLAFALGVAVIGALYPTWRAVSLTPIEALRHE